MNSQKTKAQGQTMQSDTPGTAKKSASSSQPLIDPAGKPLQQGKAAGGSREAEAKALVNRGGDKLSSGGTMISDSVQSSPVTATVAAFGIGLGAGILVGQLLVGSSRGRQSMIEQTLGRNVLRSLNSYVPDSLRDYMPG